MKLLRTLSIGLLATVGLALALACGNDSRGRNLDSLRAAVSELILPPEWRVDTVAYLELRGERYEELARWQL